ncbi:hypothetical protein DFJ73DRAFT_948080 [Zopfochytrium polystomum]|nr:hypothetical protein DFJ73DRAFT_948080 [Zopfochytrium polystomum]
MGSVSRLPLPTDPARRETLRALVAKTIRPHKQVPVVPDANRNATVTTPTRRPNKTENPLAGRTRKSIKISAVGLPPLRKEEFMRLLEEARERNRLQESRESARPAGTPEGTPVGTKQAPPPAPPRLIRRDRHAVSGSTPETPSSTFGSPLLAPVGTSKAVERVRSKPRAQAPVEAKGVISAPPATTATVGGMVGRTDGGGDRRGGVEMCRPTTRRALTWEEHVARATLRNPKSASPLSDIDALAANEAQRRKIEQRRGMEAWEPRKLSWWVSRTPPKERTWEEHVAYAWVRKPTSSSPLTAISILAAAEAGRREEVRLLMEKRLAKKAGTPGSVTEAAVPRKNQQSNKRVPF